MKPIKVVHVPFTKRNPYQRLLLDSLKNFGYKTYGVKTRKFHFLNVTLIDIILANWKPDIIHLHWHHSALLEINKLKSIIKSIFFILQIFLLKVFRIKLVWTVHNLTNHETQNHEI